MISFLIIAAIYWISCVVWFAAIQKPLFGAYNRRESREPLTADAVAAVYRHGLRSDGIVASYMTAIPLLILALAAMIPAINPIILLLVYNVILSLIVGLIATADTLLYRFWKYKIDASVLAYLRSFKGATASVSATYLAGGIGAWIIVSATFFVGSELIINAAIKAIPIHNGALSWWSYPLIIILTIVALGLLFAMIRGLGIRPNNPSIAYFSSNQFLNHWALNPVYSMTYSLSKREKFGDQFVAMDRDECNRLTEAMFPTAGQPAKNILRTPRPDIMLIVWESFGAEFTASFGGRAGVCPNFERLAETAVRFTDCTAGSFRTDRGLVNILSGYPAQPTTSIIQHTRKLPALPALARRLRDLGYVTEAIHGGDLTIMHKNDYYLASGHDQLIGQAAFDGNSPKGKWGVHDREAMMMAAEEAERIHNEDKRFFITLQTLSTHEPFDVPCSLNEDPVVNSFAYTDSALAELTERLKQSGVWDNLLLVIVADHGFNASMLPDNRRAYTHIPLLMTGGAVKGPAEIDTMMSQTDIAATILGQMDLPHDDFPFSRDILSPTYNDEFALHIFNNGIMIADKKGHTVWDTLLQRVIEGDEDPERIQRAKAILQKIYQDLDQR